ARKTRRRAVVRCVTKRISLPPMLRSSRVAPMAMLSLLALNCRQCASQSLSCHHLFSGETSRFALDSGMSCLVGGCRQPRERVMRENWSRGTELLDFTRAELNQLLQTAFPDKRVLDSSHAEGGLANTNIRVHLSGGGQPLLLRIFVRDPEQAKKELSVSELI